MLSIKLLDDYLIKSQDIKTFKIQLLRDATPYALTDDCTCTLLIANKNAIVVEEEMAIIDASQGIVEFTLHATIGTGNFDCEFLVSNGNDIHLTFPDSGYTVLKISDCLSDRPIQVITPSEYVKLNERMDGFIGELDEFEQSVTTTIDGFEVTLGTMQTQINNSINTMNSNFVTLKSGIEEQMTEMEELVSTVVDPMELTLVNDNNNFSVGVDNNGIKYDIIESPESTIELNGRTLVNIATDSKAFFSSWIITNVKKELLKPSTTYTIMCKSNNMTNDVSHMFVGDNLSKQVFLHKTKGKILKFTTPSTLDLNTYDVYVFVYPENTSLEFENGDENKFKIILLEGDYTNVPIEYFEGLQSSKPTEIKSAGKNILDISTLKENTYVLGGIEHHHNGANSFGYMEVLPNTCYVFSKCKGEKPLTINYINFFDKDKNFISNIFDTTSITTPSNAKYMRVAIFGSTFADSKIDELQIEKSTVITSYEPYKENIVTLPNIEPLRSLPNGVCDEAFIHDDKLVVTRKIHKIILNGTEVYGRGGYTSAGTRTELYLIPETFNNLFPTPAKISNSIISNNNMFPTKHSNYQPSATDVCWTFLNIHGGISICLPLVSGDRDEAVDFIKENNLTFIYQLETPTYEWYELPSPHLYKDGHVFIDTGSVPLTSTTHNINLSIRSAIDTNVEEITQLKTEHGSRLTTIENNLFKESEIEIEEPNNTFTMSDLAINTSDTKIKLNGRTLVNLWGNKAEDFNLNYEATFSDGFITASGSGNWINCCSYRAEMFKPETTYTIVANIIENTLNGRFRVNTAYQEEEPFAQNIEIPSGEKGIKIYTLTSKSDISNIRFGLRSQIHNEATTGSIKFQCIILEGDYTNVPISYFEGLKSAEPIELASTHKNVINLSDLEPTTDHVTDVFYEIKDNSITLTTNGNSKWGYRLFKIPKYLIGKTIYAKVCGDIKVEYDTNELGYPRGTCTIIERVNNVTVKQYKIMDGLQEVAITHENFFLTAYATCGVDTTDRIKYSASYNDIMISLEPFESYEPYVGDSIDLQIEPLRSSPNGICDTAELKDDKLIVTRRCKEVVLNGSEIWSIPNTDRARYPFGIALNDMKIANTVDERFELFSDSVTTSPTSESDDIGYITMRKGHGGITVWFFDVKDGYTGTNADEIALEWRTKLNSKPITLVYGLKTPIIEEYDLRTLKLYKHFFAETGAIPLTSNVHNEHYNVKDMIESNTEELLNAKRYIAKLENTIDALIVRIEALETASASVEE